MRHLAIAFLLAACGNDVGTQGGDTPDASTSAMTGEEIFKVTCARCHGDDGNGTNMGPQILDPVRPYATYVVRNGRGIEMGFADGMMAFDTMALPDADLTKVLDFLAAAPHPTDGAGLFKRFCANCHGANAAGGRVGKSIRRAPSFEVLSEARRGSGGVSYGARTKYMPAWTAAQLSDAELSLVTQYLATL